MKIITLTFTILLISNTLLISQTERGSLILNGGASVAKDLSNQQNSTTFSLFPTFAYAPVNNLFIGSRFGFSHTSFNDNNSSIASLNITPFIRYYFLPGNGRWSWFATAGYAYNNYKINFGQFESREESHSFFGGIGHNYFLNSNIAIEGILEFRYDNYESNDVRSILYGAGLQFFLPATYNNDTSNIAISKGAKLIGLNASGGWFNIGETNNLYFSVNPTLGLFINNRLVLGGGILLAFANDNAIVELQPLARYYFGTQNARFQPFAMISASTRFQFADKTSESGFFNLGVNGGIGVDYFLTPNVALEGLLQFNGNQIEDEAFNRNFLNFNIGFQFFLNK